MLDISVGWQRLHSGWRNNEYSRGFYRSSVKSSEEDRSQIQFPKQISHPPAGCYSKSGYFDFAELLPRDDSTFKLIYLQQGWAIRCASCFLPCAPYGVV